MSAAATSGATIHEQSGSPPAAQATHLRVQRQFGPYLINELKPADQLGVAAHLRHCPACARALVTYLQELRATRALLGSLPLHPAPLALRERLLAIPDYQPDGSDRGDPVCPS